MVNFEIYVESRINPGAGCACFVGR